MALPLQARDRAVIHRDAADPLAAAGSRPPAGSAVTPAPPTIDPVAQPGRSTTSTRWR
jgi:hypothetical protein